MPSRRELARRKAIVERGDKAAEHIMCQLESIVENGLDPNHCDSITELICRIVAACYWEKGKSRELQLLIENPRTIPVDKYFQETFKFGFLDELNRLASRAMEFHEQGIDRPSNLN